MKPHDLDVEPEPFTMKELDKDRKVLFCAKTIVCQVFYGFKNSIAHAGFQITYSKGISGRRLLLVL